MKSGKQRNGLLLAPTCYGFVVYIQSINQSLLDVSELRTHISILFVE